ncbi:hypothetical protein D3C87_300160 [compost metagenome]
MKNLNQLLIVGAFFGGVLISQPSLAQKMNNETQDLVIKKMERVLSAMEKGDSAWLASQQRLADLLSERARMRFMSEVEVNCNGCKGSKADRQKAIKIYESLLAEVKINEHAPILFQLAHLYEMAGQQDKAIALYERLIKNAKAQKTSLAIVSRSQASLGDLLFQKGKFMEAHAQYTAALRDKKLENRALTIYNKAWCEFNSDRLNTAVASLEALLKNPKQISRSSAEGNRYDPVFHADILRDLATFYSRRNITPRDISTYENLAPQDKRKELTLHFSEEADRVGQKQAAHRILSKYMENPDLTQDERLAAFIKMAQVNYDRGQAAQSTADFARAAAAFKKTGCSDEKKCQELEKAMKRYVTELHRSKKVKPDQDLLSAYMTYQKTFPSDIEMTKRAAQVAVDIGNTTVAIQLYRTISETRGFSDKERNEALLNEITLAEKSQNPAVQKEAYLHFLKYSSDESRKFAVRYQLAYLSYQQKQLAEAAKAFYELTQDSKGNMELRLKSAHLSLDCLAQLKDDESIERRSAEYAQAFPQSRGEFDKLSRKALMNRVAKIANDKNSSTTDYRNALNHVVNAKSAGSTPDERILFFTNQSVLAQKAGADDVYVRSLQALIAIPQLSQERRNESLTQLAAFHEKKLDFKSAYQTSLRISSKESEKDRQFRLGTLADLADMRPEKHYRAALKAGLRGDKSLVIRSRLIFLSSNPVAELKTQASELKTKPALLSEMTIFVFAKTRNKSGLKKVLAMKELKRQPAPLFVKKQDFYGKVASMESQISSLKLNSKTDRLLGKTIDARIQALKKADRLLTESLNLNDVTAQMLVLNLVTQENERLVHDLAALPMPKGLNPAQQKQYIDILKAKSKPFLYKAKVAQQKQQEIWNQSPALAQLIKDYKTVRPEVQKLLGRELQLLVQLPSTGKMKSLAESALREGSFSSRDLLSARRSVSDNPESVRDIENLKFLETKIGHPLMSSYLDARLNHIQKGRSL